ncbi:DUF3261 domain-containing protein [Chitinivorax sp. PXF-14]|uniref:DUF3261 domain-containing protein n=1 Tax=Chitinivorax sp. PXF-14 TaxID=3230488 RepID=UPI0034652173
MWFTRALPAACLLAACAQPPEAPRWTLALPPASFGQALSLQQRVTVEREGRSDSLDAVLDIAPEQLTLVGLALGQRVLTLSYDGSKLSETRHPLLPDNVRGADILSDVELALWPAGAIRAALPAGWSLDDSEAGRVLRHGSRTVASIRYTASPRWQGRIELNNQQYGYRLTILSQPNDP